MRIATLESVEEAVSYRMEYFSEKFEAIEKSLEGITKDVLGYEYSPEGSCGMEWEFWEFWEFIVKNTPREEDMAEDIAELIDKAYKGVDYVQDWCKYYHTWYELSRLKDYLEVDDML